jgi:hypothetical protein
MLGGIVSRQAAPKPCTAVARAAQGRSCRIGCERHKCEGACGYANTVVYEFTVEDPSVWTRTDSKRPLFGK